MKKILLLLLLLLLAPPAAAQVRIDGQSNIDIGAGTATTLNTGNGDNELFAMDQNVRSTDTYRAAALNVGAAGTGFVMTAGNGSVRWLGDGNGTDEDIVLGLNASNLATISSATGVVSFAFSGMTVSANAISSTIGYYNNAVEWVAVGAPAVSSCGDGALQTGSVDSFGRVVGTTQTACTITFSNALGTNGTVCVVENITANRGNVSATSTTAFTVSNLTAGDDFDYICVGR